MPPSAAEEAIYLTHVRLEDPSDLRGVPEAHCADDAFIRGPQGQNLLHCGVPVLLDLLYGRTQARLVAVLAASTILVGSARLTKSLMPMLNVTTSAPLIAFRI